MDAEKQERANLWEYIDWMALWTYNYIYIDNKHLIERVTAAYTTNGKTKLSTQAISSQEIGIIALASIYHKTLSPNKNTEWYLKEVAEYQFALQSYIGITDVNIVTGFYEDIIRNLKPEHNSLIPVIHTYHTQIHALKIAYDSLKVNLASANLATRVLFGLICIEFMKLKIRLYLIEPVARMPEWSKLDWIYMLDEVFKDFSFEPESNRASLRKKNIVAINAYQEEWLYEVLKSIKDIRDEVNDLKQIKAWVPIEKRAINNNSLWFASAKEYLNIVRWVRRRIWKNWL